MREIDLKNLRDPMNNLQEGQDLPETAYIILSAYIYIYGFSKLGVHGFHPIYKVSVTVLI